MAIEVRRLTEQDARIFRDIRLEALEAYPEAFQSTYETAADLPLEAYAVRIQMYALFGGFIDGTLRGIVGFSPLRNPKIAHKGILWGMYVQPDARGTGLAEAMVTEALEHAKGSVEQVLISIITANERARRFYGKMGFEPYGIEPRALKMGGKYFDEEFRVKFLDR
ncbi:MAG TPA: GNAT family N-acetyltransferase [Alphaproteobacteria bacterium]|nr:GNAT family N-acetyltransferase [Alphaproteobacteria bacterium]